MKVIKERHLEKDLFEIFNHGREEPYLEFKGNISWEDREKRLEIIKTILALSNNKDGGYIIIGINNEGEKIGLSEENFHSFDNDKIGQKINKMINQKIEFKVEKYVIELEKEKVERRFVFIRVEESKEFPVIYSGKMKKINKQKEAFPDNTAFRTGALYIRSRNPVGNKEIETIQEWQELIERCIDKWKVETLRRYHILKAEEKNPFDEELKI